uniref:Uncharacterized protein n=1 Tax=Anguilla anguilla TaxID=7936 RepID=A0A0E9UUM4_ANGAN
MEPGHCTLADVG